MPADPSGLERLQRAMVRAVHGDATAFGDTAATIDGAGLDPEKRLFIHLNTVNHALIAVLEQAYPATAALLGAARFADLAKAFAHARPPERPVLSAYGAGFAGYLADAGAITADLAGLPALDWAAHEAYFAASAAVLSGERLAALAPEDHAALRFSLVPSARIVGLAGGNAWARWAALLAPDEVAVTAPTGDAAAALIWRRPDLRVAARGLSAGEAAFLDALTRGASLLTAAEAAGDGGDVDLATMLGFCLADGVFKDNDATDAGWESADG